MNSKKTNSENKNICPYLGFDRDPNTAMAFPSRQNICHKIESPGIPNIDYQSRYCLSPKHNECKVFLASSKDSLKKYRHIFTKPPKTQAKVPLKYVILAVLLLVAGFYLFQFISSSKLFASTTDESPIPFPTRTAIVLPGLEETDETPVPTSSPSPIKPTQTLRVTEPRMVETPFGLQWKFIVHSALAGESIESLAQKYKTTKEAIQKVNYQMDEKLWEGELIVIPFDRSKVHDVPAMTPYIIKVDGKALETLAFEQSVDEGLLRQWNGLPRGYRFRLDEVVIIPHEDIY